MYFTIQEADPHITKLAWSSGDKDGPNNKKTLQLLNSCVAYSSSTSKKDNSYAVNFILVFQECLFSFKLDIQLHEWYGGQIIRIIQGVSK